MAEKVPQMMDYFEPRAGKCRLAGEELRLIPNHRQTVVSLLLVFAQIKAFQGKEILGAESTTSEGSDD